MIYFLVGVSIIQNQIHEADWFHCEQQVWHNWLVFFLTHSIEFSSQEVIGMFAGCIPATRQKLPYGLMQYVFIFEFSNACLYVCS